MKKFYLPILLLTAVLFRLPMLINAEQMNSDFAFIGLQALKVLEGEFSWYLWKSSYQASFEALIAAGLFLVFGKSFFVLQLVPMIAFLACIVVTYKILEKELGAPKAFILCFFFVFCTINFIFQNVFPYRQWSILFCLLPLWMAQHAKTKIQWVLCGFLPFFALFVDFFTIQFWIPLLIFITLAAKKNKKYASMGFFIGLVLMGLSRTVMKPQGGKGVTFSPRLPSLPIFVKESLPDLFGIYNYIGVAILLFALFQSGRYYFDRKKTPDYIKLLTLFGFLQIASTSLGFVGHRNATPNVRYITPLIYALPFALAGFAFHTKIKKMAFMLLPYFIVIAVQGWKDMTGDFKIRKDPTGTLKVYKEMGDYLRSQNIKYGYANYWVAYQLTFLYLEKPILVNRTPHPIEDRYQPYKDNAVKEEKLAELYLPQEADQAEAALKKLTQSHRLLSQYENHGYRILIRKN